LDRIDPACVRCAAPLPRPGVCGQCQRRPPAFDRAVAAFRYRAPLDAMVKRLKFHGDLQLARLLGSLMAERVVQSAEALPEVIVPVPLHPRRLRRRGYNQALELARPIARRLAVPLEWHQVMRVRATDPQTEVPAPLRSRNVKDAFAVTPGFCARRVAIVDDVMTTGHTINELAKALCRAGATEISAWVCTRAVFGR
jgi:ComF family protein